MSPTAIEAVSPIESEVTMGEGRSLEEIWRSLVNWVARTAGTINNETLEHPYLISLALFVLWAWPHILMLPVWFGKDGYRRMDTHARTALDRAIEPVRRRKRDNFVSTYRSIVNASYEPRYADRAPLFGGTPLTEGDFTVEEDRHLPIALRIIRWGALTWAAFILGRELYFALRSY